MNTMDVSGGGTQLSRTPSAPNDDSQLIKTREDPLIGGSEELAQMYSHPCVLESRPDSRFLFVQRIPDAKI